MSFKHKNDRMSKSEATKRASDLRQQINYHRKKYYVDAQPEITDYEYDMLEKELAAIESEFPELITPDSPTQRIGGEPVEEFATVPHTRPMLSLDNAYNIEEIAEFDRRLRKLLGEESLDYVAELKIDGVSIAVRYTNGLLERGITRGDGMMGEDVTPNLRTIKSVPLRLMEDIPTLEVRGEVYMPRAAFEKMNRERKKNGDPLFANPRNAAAGSIRLLDQRVTAARELDIYFWALADVRGSAVETHWEGLQKIRDLGLKTNPTSRLCSGIAEAIAYCDEWEEKKNGLPYDIDGVVLKLNRLTLQEKAGATSKFPRWALAYKYPAMQASTVVKNIIVQVGRTGALTPVADLEPVSLAGSVISRATLHNEEEIKRKDIRIGDTVIIEKGGEVIPKVVKVVEKKRPKNARIFKMPDRCPVCKSKVFKPEDEAIARCTGASCPAKLKESILHFASRGAMDIEGLGEALVDQLIAQDMIKDFSSIYALRQGEIAALERMGQKSAENLIAEIERSKKQPLHRLIFALGIRLIGERAAKILASHFHSMDRLAEIAIEEFTSIREIGPKMAESIIMFFSQKGNIELIQRLKKYGLNTEEKIKKGAPKQLFEGKTFVLTGTLGKYTRERATEIIESLGGKVSSSVSAKTDFILAGAEAGSKLEKAKKLGVRIVAEAEFLKMLERSGPG